MIGVLLAFVIFGFLGVIALVAGLAHLRTLPPKRVGFCKRERYHDGPCNGFPNQTCFVYSDYKVSPT